MSTYLILAVVSFLVTSIGFRYYIHFFSVGYGFAIAALALAMGVLFMPVLTLPTILMCLLLLVAGIWMEALADKQKSDAKKKTPGRFVDTGLYRLVRCPNYLGELLLWVGVFVSGIGYMSGWQWIPAISGLILIFFVMFSGAKRLELRQNASYSCDPEYQRYVQTVPIILPFVPLYSVVKYKFLVA